MFFKDDVSLSPLEVKELYFKEILPHLNTNNYGYDEETVKNLKNLSKIQLEATESTVGPTISEAEVEAIDQLMDKIHNTFQQANDVFRDPNDPLNVSTKYYPRQSLNNTFDELHRFPIFDMEENVNEPQRSENGNVHVRDEIGSSIQNRQISYSHLDHRKAPYSYVSSYPMYNFETCQIEAGKIDLPKENQRTAKNTILDFYMCDI